MMKNVRNFTLYILLFTLSFISRPGFGGATPVPLPLQWDCNFPEARAQTFQIYQGETVEFAPTFKINGSLATNISIEAVWIQTNGMQDAWWKLDNATFHPSNDVGAAAYRFFVEAHTPSDSNQSGRGSGVQPPSPCKIYRANGTLRMLPSPGFTPAEIPWPVRRLDFAAIELANAPWPDEISSATNAVFSAAKSYTDSAIAQSGSVTPEIVSNIVVDVAPAPGNYAAVSNAAMSAIQSYLYPNTVDLENLKARWLQSTPWGNMEVVDKFSLWLQARKEDWKNEVLAQVPDTSLAPATNYTDAVAAAATNYTDSAVADKMGTVGHQDLRGTLDIFSPLAAPLTLRSWDDDHDTYGLSIRISSNRWTFVHHAIGIDGGIYHTVLPESSGVIALATDIPGAVSNILANAPWPDEISSATNAVFSAAKSYTDSAIAQSGSVTPEIVSNIVVDVAPAPGNYAAVSNAAMNAIQSYLFQSYHYPNTVDLENLNARWIERTSFGNFDIVDKFSLWLRARKEDWKNEVLAQVPGAVSNIVTKAYVEDLGISGGGGTPLAGRTFDFATTQGVMDALKATIEALGGTVTNAPTAQTQLSQGE